MIAVFYFFSLAPGIVSTADRSCGKADSANFSLFPHSAPLAAAGGPRENAPFSPAPSPSAPPQSNHHHPCATISPARAPRASRAAGSRFARSAGRYIGRRSACLGLRPFGMEFQMGYGAHRAQLSLFWLAARPALYPASRPQAPPTAPRRRGLLARPPRHGTATTPPGPAKQSATPSTMCRTKTSRCASPPASISSSRPRRSCCSAS